jgi:hypothetical protein
VTSFRESSVPFAVFLAFAAAACGGADAAAPRRHSEHSVIGDAWTGRTGVETAPTAREQRVIDGLARAAERVRGLEFIVPVETAVQDRQAIIGYLTSELEDEDLETARELYIALGLLPPDLDIRDLLERVLGEQVAGYYDPDTDRLVIRDDIMRMLGRGEHSVDETRVTIVHELVHALQDQHLELGERFEDDRDTDADGAYRAVVEGDATLAMIGYAAEEAGGRLEDITQHPERLQQLMSGAAPIGDDELAAAPPILRVTLISAYLDGLVFTAHLHGLGGFDAVDEAHRHPPVSTEQVLHPEKFTAGELPDPLTLPDFPELERAGYEKIEEDTLGELEMKVYFGQLERDGVLPSAAEGWSGDRLRIYRAPTEGGLSACVWFTAWDDESEAREAETAARRILEAVAQPERSSHRVERRGRALLIIRNLAPNLHAPIARSFGATAEGLSPAPPRAAPVP